MTTDAPVDPRVLVAQDALAMLQKAQLLVYTGNYVQVRKAEWATALKQVDRTLQNDSSRSQEESLDAKAVLDQVIASAECEVCALGALLVAHIRRYDAVTLHEADLIGGDGSRAGCQRVLACFSHDDLALIEHAFEGWEGGVLLNAVNGRPWLDTYEQDDERLMEILKNIIRNNGVFNIEEVSPPTPA